MLSFTKLMGGTLAFLLLAAVLGGFPSVSDGAVNLDPPAQPVNLLWIHHSTGGIWAHKHDPDGSGAWNDGVAGVQRDSSHYGTRHYADSGGGNGEVALFNSNYIMHHLTYESRLGDSASYTDYANWHRKFRNYLDRTDAAHYVNDVEGADLVHCYAQDISYAAKGTDEFTGDNVSSQTNQVIMFKSCFPNSAVTPADTSTGLPANPTLAEARAWIAGSGYSDWESGGGAGGPINYIQAEYMALLDVFGEERYRNILFVAWVAPPETTSTNAQARELADWFQNQWLAQYPWNNVLLFNYWNVHTGEHGSGGAILPAFQARHNHDRYNPFLGRRDYVGPGDPDFVDDLRMAFPASPDDSHPNHFGGAVATKELVNLLNIQWNKMRGIPPTGTKGYPTNGRTGFFKLDATYGGTLPAGVTKGMLDGVSCLIFSGSPAAELDLGPVTVSGTNGAFSYSFWYRPANASTSLGNYTTILRKPDVFEVHHYAEDEQDSHLNTLFGNPQDYVMAPDHRAFLVDKETWTHVAFVWNGSAARLYVDGAQIVETFAIAGKTVPDNANHLYIGGGNGAVCGGIRELAIYDRALSAAEVRGIFNANAVSEARAADWTIY